MAQLFDRLGHSVLELVLYSCATKQNQLVLNAINAAIDSVFLVV